jgi:hypothetical protein
MKELRISRRQALGGLMATPLVSLTGCGSSTSGLPSPPVDGPAQILGGDTAVPAAGPAGTPGQLNPVFTYFHYSGYGAAEPDSTEAPPYTTSGVTPTADRLDDGALCFAFAGAGSSVQVEHFSGFPTGDFAILLWVRSTSSTPAQILQVGSPSLVAQGLDALSIGIGVTNRGHLQISGTSVEPIGSEPVSNFPPITDGLWHHIAVQKYGSTLQVFVDGLPFTWPPTVQGLSANSIVVIGGGWDGAIDSVRMYNRSFAAQVMPQVVYKWTQTKLDSGGATGSILAYFPLNGTAQNALGYGVEGVPVNVTPTTDRNGSIGGAYLFNGVNSSVSLNQPFESTDGDFAIAFWEQSAAGAPMCAVSVTSGGGATSSLDFLFNGAGAALTIALDGVPLPGLSSGTAGSLTNGAWHWVFLQRTSGTMQLYVDGTLVASASSSAGFFGGNSVVQFGVGSGASAAVSSFWSGALSGVQIYQQSMTAPEIASLMQLQFLGRDGVGALAFNGKMWLLGGWNPDYQPATCSEVWCSEDGINWTWVTDAPWQRRHDAGWAVYDNKMWVVGGDHITGSYQNDVWSSSDGLNWELVTDSVPWANRATQYVLYFNGRLWLMGGQKIQENGVPPGPVVAYNDVWSSTDGANWTQVSPAAGWSPRGMIMGSAVFRGLMWVISGGQYDIRTFNNDVWSSPDGVNWTQVALAAPWAPRQFQNIAAFHDKLWVLAGGDAESQGGLNDVWYSPDGATWVQLGSTPWVARHAASTVVYDGFLWFTCGSDQYPNSDVWKLGYAP